MSDTQDPRPSLAELRAMLRAATPGPWLLETSAGGYMPSIIQSDRRQIVCLTGQAPMTDPEGRPVTELMMANARLVAEMHAAFLPLLDIAEAAQTMFETADRSGENADVWFEGDRMEATEQALKGVRP